MRKTISTFSLLSCIFSLTLSFTAQKTEIAGMNLKSAFSYVCRLNDYDKVTNVSVFPNRVYDNTNNTGSDFCPPSNTCYTLNHEPNSQFSCNDVGSRFCCAQKLNNCTGSQSSYLVRIHCKSE